MRLLPVSQWKVEPRMVNGKPAGGYCVSAYQKDGWRVWKVVPPVQSRM